MARLALTANYAVAYAVKMCDVDVIPIYPITPQTTIAEKLTEFVANGELDAEIIYVESEHSALSACTSAAAAGARTFTATCSQGLMLAYELLPIISGMRLPVVMAVPTRAVSAPLSIHGDYSDLMLARDVGWIIFIVSSAQEAFDTIVQAFKISEDSRVLLPSMVAYDGFLVSHVLEPVEIPDDESVVRRFVQRQARRLTLDPQSPVTMCPVAGPDWLYEIRYQQVDAMRRAYEASKSVFNEFAKVFGRSYDVIETYRMDDAEYAMITYGAMWGFLQEAIDRARARGIRVGGVRIRMFRPLPVDEIVKCLQRVRGFGVVDKSMLYGLPGGPLYEEIALVLKQHDISMPSVSFVHGIGQRTMYVKDFEDAIDVLVKQVGLNRSREDVVYLGLRT